MKGKNTVKKYSKAICMHMPVFIQFSSLGLMFIIQLGLYAQPDDPITQDTNVYVNAACAITSVYLTAESSSGMLRWYDDSVGGNLLDSTPVFLAADLTTDTAFFVSQWDYANAVSGNAVSNNGTVIQVNNTASMVGTEVTFETWFYATRTGVNTPKIITDGSYMAIVSMSTGDEKTISAGLDLNPSLGFVQIHGSTPFVNDGSWHHVALVYDASKDSMFLYLDGLLEAQGGDYGSHSFSAGSTTSGGIRFGGQRANNDADINGGIDQARIWERALSHAEVVNAMDKCVPANAEDLYFYVDMEDGTSSTDLTGNHSPTISGSAESGPSVACDVTESGRSPLHITLLPSEDDAFYTRDYIVCESGANQVISAWGGSNQYRWYTQSVGGELIDSLPTILVENILADTSLYVASWDYGNPSVSTSQRGMANSLLNLNNCDDLYANLSQFTVEVWVKTTRADRRIIMFNSSGDMHIQMSNYGAAYGAIGWQMDTDFGTEQLVGTKLVNDGDWHHLAFIFDQGQASIYFDGELDTTETLTGSRLNISTSANNLVGGQGFNGDYAWDGELDEFRIWSLAKNQQEIIDQMNTCLQGKESDLLVYVNYDNDTIYNLTGKCDIPGYSSFYLSGPQLSCSICESSRQAVNIDLVGYEISTQALDSSSYSSEDSISIPFAICQSATPCSEDYMLNDDFNNGVLGSQWTSLDETSGSTGTVDEPGEVMVLVGEGDNIWGATNEFVVLSRSDLTGEFDVSTKISAIKEGSRKTGLVVANDFSDNDFSSSGYAAVFVQDNNMRFRVDENGDGQLNETIGDATAISLPIWLRIAKDGSNAFTAYYKQNAGDAWISLGSASAGGTNNNSLVGLFHSGIGALSYALFDDFACSVHSEQDTFSTDPLDAAWVFDDLDANANTGSYGVGPLILEGVVASNELWADPDNAKFISVIQDTVTGSFTSTIKLLGATSGSNSYDRTIFGVSSNFSSALKSGFAGVLISEGQGYAGIYYNGGASMERTAFTTPVQYPCWLRIQKNNRIITAYYSTDGSNFTELWSDEPFGIGDYSQVGILIQERDGNSKSAVFDEYESTSYDDSEFAYFAELSDIGGDFTSPTGLKDTLYVLNSDICISNQGIIATSLPASLTSGTGYRIRVVQLAPDSTPDTASISPTVITINPPTGVSGEIVGLVVNDTICSGTSVTLSLQFTGDPPFTFSLEDNSTGSWNNVVVEAVDLAGSNPYTYDFTIPDIPQWQPPDRIYEISYSLSAVTDDLGGLGTIIGDPVVLYLYKRPSTGEFYYVP